MMLARRFGGALTETAAYGFIEGALAGGLLAAAFQLGGLRRALKDDTALRRLCNQEHDERMQDIRAKAGFPMMVIWGVAMIAAGLAASFVSETVAITLIATGAVQMLACAIAKRVYMRRM